MVTKGFFVENLIGLLSSPILFLLTMVGFHFSLSSHQKNLVFFFFVGIFRKLNLGHTLKFFLL